MIRVLHSIFSVRPETGGPARSVPALVDQLRVQGVDARLKVFDEGCEGTAGACGTAGPGGSSQDWSPEIVHDHGVWLPSNHEIASWSRRQGGVRVVSPRGMLEPWSMRHRWLKKKAAWLLYQRRDLRSARCLHATSAQEAAQFRKLGLLQPVIVLPNGVSLPETALPRPAGERTRVILFMSRLHPKKGLPLLIDAWRRIRMPKWRLRIVGPDEGGHAATIRGLAAEAGIEGEVSIEGPVDDSQKWDVYSSADLLILPTYSENFGIVVAEALAAGVPVITTTGTPWRELESWGAGWCVEPAVDAIEAALRAAVSLSDGERCEMGKRGQRSVRERFAWPAIAGQMRDAYEWLLRGGTRPECVQVD